MNRIFGFEPRTALALLRHCGNATEIFRMKESDIDLLLGPYSKYRGKLSWKAVEKASAELSRLSSSHISFCGYGETSYPRILAECEDCPIGLYVRSESPTESLWRSDSIAVIGTRDISPYGREWCERIVSGLASTDLRPTIVSGLALGTDITAHRCAIECGLPTIGVMATGPDAIYPSRHQEFAERMVSTPGCALVTDYPPGTAPLAIHFIRRNRIIAGLSRASVLVESKIRGGGMATCRLAFSYDRDVFCLPGRINDIRSQGCNELIRQKIAEPVTSIERLTESLGMVSVRSRDANCDELIESIYRNRLDEAGMKCAAGLLQTIRRNTGICIDELAASTGLDRRKVAELVNLLEIDGLISTDLFQRCSIKTKKM